MARINLGDVTHIKEYDVEENENTTSWEDFMYQSIGISMPIPEDGKIHRFATDRNKPYSKDGWAVYYKGDISIGVCGSWRDNNKYTWCSKNKETMTSTERMYFEKRQAEIKQKEIAEQEKAKENCNDYYAALDKASDEYPYLKNKLVRNWNNIIKLGIDNRLVVPLYDKNGEIISLQYINEKGEKQFQSKAKAKGGRLVLDGDCSTVYLCEGYATGYSIWEATGCKTVVCFNCGNIKEVAPDYPKAIAIADNDENGAGEKGAKESGLDYFLIPEVGMDANDYVKKYGAKRLQTILGKGDDWLVSGNEVISNPAPVEYIVKNWIAKDNEAMFFAPPGVGKSFVAIDLALTVATHQESWHGNKCKGGGVVYLTGEGFVGLKGRIKAWCVYHKVADLSEFAICRYALDLDKETSRIKKAIATLPFKPILIVVDTLNRFMDGDENSSQDVRVFVNALKDIRGDYDKCSSLTIHHTGVMAEAQGRGRGSSAIQGSMDTVASISQSKEGKITIHQTKQKDLELQSDISLYLVDVDTGWVNEDGEPILRGVLVDVPEKEAKKEKAKAIEAKIDELKTIWKALGSLRDEEQKAYIERKDLREYYNGSSKKVEQFEKKFEADFEKELIVDKSGKHTVYWLTGAEFILVNLGSKNGGKEQDKFGKG